MARRLFAIVGLLVGLIAVSFAGEQPRPEIVATLKGHADAVYAVAFSPDGKFIATASFDGTIKLWDSATFKEIKTYTGHTKQVISVAFNQDGSMLASGGTDNTLKVWDVPVRTPIRSLKTNDAASAVALSPDGTKLAIGGKDGMLRLVTPTEFKEIVKFDNKHQGAITSLAFNANGQVLASTGADRTLRYWNVLNGQLQSIIGAHHGSANRVVINPNNTAAYTVGEDGMLRFWALPPAPLAKSIPISAASQVLVMSPDNASFYTGGDDKIVRQFGLAAAKELRALAGSQSAISSVAIHPQSAFIAAGAVDGRVHLWNNADGKPLADWLAHAGAVTAVQVQPQGQQLMTAGADGAVKLWPIPKPGKQPEPKPISTWTAHPAGPTFGQYHANGQHLLTAGADKTVKLWDMAKTNLLKSFGPLADPIKAVAFSKDFAKVGAAAGKVVKVWTLADGKEIVSLRHQTEVLSLSFSQDGARIATGSADKLTWLWDIATARELQFFAQDGRVDALALLPNNSIVSAAGKTVRLDTPSILRAMAADAGPTHSLAIIPANTHLVTAGADKIIKLWNVNNGVKEREFTGATGTLQTVAISKNGILLASGSADHAVRVYTFADGKEIASVKVNGPIRSLGFTPNNLALVVATTNKTLQAFGAPFTPGQPLSPDFLKPVQTFDAADVADLAIAADNAAIYSAGQDKAMHVWKLASPVATRNFNYGVNVDAVAFQPNGTFVAAAGHDGKVRIFDLVKQAVVKDISAHIGKGPNNQPQPEPIYTLVYSNDGKQLLTSSYDNSLKLWDAASGNLVREFKPYKVKDFEKGHQEPVYTAAFSPDGKFIASGSSGLERTIKIWNLGDGSVVRDLANPHFKSAPPFPPPSHPGAVTALRFTKDGKHLVSVGDAPGNKGYLAIWDWQAGKLVYASELPLGVFYGLAISPDQKLIAVTAGNRGVRGVSPDFNATYLMKMPALK